jgi:predicted Zn finger-like uncharacterized protein
MLVNCKSCQKKFIVPDSAVAESGRLLQCGSCGNKWTQYPIKEKPIKEIAQTALIKKKQQTTEKKIKASIKKKKREINLYSDEYLKKKYGLEIKNPLDIKKKNTSNFSFLNFFIITIVFLITLFGILNLTKSIIVMNYPFTEFYINFIYEILRF